MASDLIERLTKCALGSADEDVMVRWDKIRAILKQDKGGTWPRECFESIIDAYAEDCEDAVREITSLRTALAIERERAEKAERRLASTEANAELRLQRLIEANNRIEEELLPALAEAKRLMKVFATFGTHKTSYVELPVRWCEDAAGFLAQEAYRPTEEPQR